jgi:hypothetical protein
MRKEPLSQHLATNIYEPPKPQPSIGITGDNDPQNEPITEVS